MSDDVNGANILARKQAEVDTLRARVEELTEENGKLHRWLNEHLTMQHRVCKEGFGYDDTIGGEPFDDYMLRQIAALKAELKTGHAIAHRIAILYEGHQHVGRCPLCDLAAWRERNTSPEVRR